MEASENVQDTMGMNPSASTNYAGFWIRLVAYIIDAIVLLIPNYAIGMMVSMEVANILSIVIYGGYVIYFLSSEMMATPGKMAVGLIVTDGDGNRISAGTAATRWIGYFISAIVLLIGFIMIGFTEKKEGLHDKIAGTLVVYKN